MRLVWGQTGSRIFEAGVDRGVLFPSTGPGVPWDGLVSVKEDVDNTDQTIMYVDGQKYLTQVSLGTFSASIGAITYPLEFEPYDGYEEHFSNQSRDRFGFSYRTQLGNDIGSTDYGYQIHIVYNCLAQPSDRVYNSLTNAVDITVLEWGVTTIPMDIPDMRASSHFIVDSTQIPAQTLIAIENILYGTDLVNPSIPSIADLLSIFELYAIYKIIDNGDGSWTAIGPDDAFDPIDAITVDLIWPDPAIFPQSPIDYNIKSY